MNLPSDTICICSPGSACTRFLSETYFGSSGQQAKYYKEKLWWATSGHVLGEEALAALKTEVATVLGVGNNWPFPTTGLPPRFHCAQVWTIKLLRYRLCQGSLHTAAAIILVPSFPPGHLDWPVLGCLAGVIGQVMQGDIPNYKTHAPNLATVWPNGVLPAGYKTDLRFTESKVSEVWRTWAKLRAAEMLGQKGVWVKWQYEDIAPRPSVPMGIAYADDHSCYFPPEHPCEPYESPFSSFAQTIPVDIEIPQSPYSSSAYSGSSETSGDTDSSSEHTSSASDGYSGDASSDSDTDGSRSNRERNRPVRSRSPLGAFVHAREFLPQVVIQSPFQSPSLSPPAYKSPNMLMVPHSSPQPCATDVPQYSLSEDSNYDTNQWAFWSPVPLPPLPPRLYSTPTSHDMVRMPSMFQPLHPYMGPG